jgi:hypothetical protein
MLTRLRWTAALLLAGASAAQAEMSGRWSGSYACDEATGTFVLDATEPTPGRIEGTFSFVTDGRSGSYAVRGTLGDDGRAAILPGAWIERPAGMRSLGMTVRVDDGGRRIVGRMEGCGFRDSVEALRENTGTAADGSAPSRAAPPDWAPVSGTWSGHVTCRPARKSSDPVMVPVEASLLVEGAGALLVTDIEATPRGGGAGGTIRQTTVLSGTLDGGRLAIDTVFTIDNGGARPMLRGLGGTLSDDGASLSGEVRMQGCTSVALSRTGDIRAGIELDALAGVWRGTASGRGGDTAVSVEVSPGGPTGVLTLSAAYPAERAEVRRDHLETVLVPVGRAGDAILLGRVGKRRASGVFDGGVRRHGLGEAAVFAAALADDGSLRLRSILREADLRDVAGSSAGAWRDAYVLGKADATDGAAVSAGEMPPVAFAGSIGGLLAAAPSREAQCRVLETWLAPYAAGADPKTMSQDALRAALTEAFSDPVFEPVFGVAYLSTTQPERTDLRRFGIETCQRGLGMTLVGMVAGLAFVGESQFARLSATIADRANALAWAAEVRDSLPGYPDTEAGIAMIAALREEFELRRRDLSEADDAALRSDIDARGQAIRAFLLREQLDSLPTRSVDDGDLAGLLAFARKVKATEDLSDADRADILADAARRAWALAEPVLDGEARRAAAAPLSLDGLAAIRSIELDVGPMEAGLIEAFGPVGPDPLRPMRERRDQVEEDAGVRAAFETVLRSAEPGEEPGRTIMELAGRYIDPERLAEKPAFAVIVEEAVADAERRAIRVSDRGGGSSPGEPTAEEIAAFAYERIRQANADIRAREEHCVRTKGGTNAVEALYSCLNLPATWTGQVGFGVRLIAVEKIGCRPEVEERQFLCMFTQDVGFKVPDGRDVDLDMILPGLRRLASNEVLDARFVRADGDQWTVIWGELE